MGNVVPFLIVFHKGYGGLYFHKIEFIVLLCSTSK